MSQRVTTLLLLTSCILLALTSVAVSEQVELEYLFWGSQSDIDGTMASIEAFEAEYPHIKVNAMVSDVNILRERVVGGLFPDVSMVTADTALAFGEAGLALDLLPLVQGDKEFSLSDWLAPTFYWFNGGKSLLGVPYSFNVMVMYYNSDRFDEAGLARPSPMPKEAWTWQRFAETARKLRQPGAQGSPRYGAGTRGFWLEWLAWVWSNGGDIFDEAGWKETLTNPDNVSALQAMAEEIASRESVLYDTGISRQVEYLIQGKTAMYVDLSWRWNVIGQADASIDVAPVPYFRQPTALLSGSPRMIMAATQHPWEAWLLYKWLQDPARSLPYFRDGGAQPVVTSWLSQPSLWRRWQGNRPDSWYYASNMNAAMYGRPHPGFYLKNWGEVINPLDAAVQGIFRGSQSPQTALEQVSNIIASQLKGRLDR